MDIRTTFGSAPLPDFNDYARTNPDFKDIRSGRELIAAYPSLPLFTKPGNCYKIYNTRTHADIYSILLEKAINLSTGEYNETRGLSCSTLICAKGVGKTTLLTAFTHLCKYVVPNVYVVYVSFLSRDFRGEEFVDDTLVAIVIRHLRELHVEIPETCLYPEDLVEYLQERNINLLVLVDELEQLYRSVVQSSVVTLRQLAYLGTQCTGRVSVVICGTSLIIMDLITSHAARDEHMRLLFPLLTESVPDLNPTAFRPVTVYSALPVDLEALAGITDVSFDDQANLPWLRLVAFVVGCCSALAVQTLLLNNESDSFYYYGYNRNSAALQSRRFGEPDLLLLRDGILSRLWGKNRMLLEQILDPPKEQGEGVLTLLRVSKIATIDWENQFQPLSFAEVDSIWRGLLSRGAVRKENSGNLVDNLVHLSDMSCLILGPFVDSRPQTIYPYSLSDIVIDFPRPTVSMGNLMVDINRGAAGLASYLLLLQHHLTDLTTTSAAAVAVLGGVETLAQSCTLM